MNTLPINLSHTPIEGLSSSEPDLVVDRGAGHKKSRFYADSGRYDLVKQKLYKRIQSHEIEYAFFSELGTILKNLENPEPELHLPVQG